MTSFFSDYFEMYPANVAPFLHQQLDEWRNSKPLQGLKVLHHLPVVENTLLKIANLSAAGAQVVVTNPSFLQPHQTALLALQKEGYSYVEDLSTLNGNDFDLYFDSGAELFQKLGPPRIGAIELTCTGNTYYQKQKVNFPIINIDHSYTKQIETILGAAVSTSQAIEQLTNINTKNKAWLIFGFGKIGHGVAYFCVHNQVAVTIVDINPNTLEAARMLGIRAINASNTEIVEAAIATADIIVTATGVESVLNNYSKELFKGKLLANLGVVDEFGPIFNKHEVLNNRLPINFVLKDPTPMQYMDPTMYAHNKAALQLLNTKLPSGVTHLSKELDNEIVTRWCDFHGMTLHNLQNWFCDLDNV